MVIVPVECEERNRDYDFLLDPENIRGVSGGAKGQQCHECLKLFVYGEIYWGWGCEHSTCPLEMNSWF